MTIAISIIIPLHSVLFIVKGKGELLYAFGNKYPVRPASIRNTHGCTRAQIPDTGSMVALGSRMMARQLPIM